MLNDHTNLSLLISGQMTAWCDGLPIHAILPGQFINSIEWISLQKLKNSQQVIGWEQQIMVNTDEDSAFLRVSLIVEAYL